MHGQESFLLPVEIMQMFGYINTLDENLPREDTTKLLLEVLLFTGLRCEEVADLQLQDLPISAEFPKFSHHSQVIFVNCGKGGVQREIDVTDVFRERIVDYVTHHRKTTATRKTSYLFEPEGVNRHGALHSATIRARIKRHGKKIGIPRLHTHMFRHTFATYHLAYYRDIKYTQEQLGHSNFSTTNCYTGRIKNVSDYTKREIFREFCWETKSTLRVNDLVSYKTDGSAILPKSQGMYL